VEASLPACRRGGPGAQTDVDGATLRRLGPALDDPGDVGDGDDRLPGKEPDRQLDVLARRRGSHRHRDGLGVDTDLERLFRREDVARSLALARTDADYPNPLGRAAV